MGGIDPYIKENHGLTCTPNKIIDLIKNPKHQQDNIQDSRGICRTIPAGTHASTPHLLKTLVFRR